MHQRRRRKGWERRYTGIGEPVAAKLDEPAGEVALLLEVVEDNGVACLIVSNGQAHITAELADTMVSCVVGVLFVTVEELYHAKEDDDGVMDRVNGAPAVSVAAVTGTVRKELSLPQPRCCC